jgi:C4-dicarboxylate-specific signal transduction histidine kinase
LLAQAESARADAESARARAELKAGELAMANKALTDSQNHLIQAGKLAGLGLLVSGIAHELNNPLQLITANAESLTFRLDREKDGEVARHLAKGLKRILKGADRCGSIIRGLLRFARQSENEMATLDMRDVVTSTLEFTRSQLRRRGAKVRVDLPLEALFVCGDSTQLSQVLVTLLLNAADAMDGGGEIVVSVVHHEDTVFLSVQDDGCGIGPDVLPHIFDPFFTTKVPGQGTGLGLSISHSIVDGHGGRIDVESAQEEGSTFTVSLPLLAS